MLTIHQCSPEGEHWSLLSVKAVWYKVMNRAKAAS